MKLPTSKPQENGGSSIVLRKNTERTAFALVVHDMSRRSRSRCVREPMISVRVSVFQSLV